MRLQKFSSTILAAVLLVFAAAPSWAQPQQKEQVGTYQPSELVDSGHRFFGTVSRGLALTLEEAIRRFGEPNGYILGQEGSGAFVAGPCVAGDGE